MAVWALQIADRSTDLFSRLVYADLYLNTDSILRKLPDFGMGRPSRGADQRKTRRNHRTRKRTKPRRRNATDANQTPTTRKNETTTHTERPKLTPNAKDQQQTPTNYLDQRNHRTRRTTRDNTECKPTQRTNETTANAERQRRAPNTRGQKPTPNLFTMPPFRGGPSDSGVSVWALHIADRPAALHGRYTRSAI